MFLRQRWRNPIGSDEGREADGRCCLGGMDQIGGKFEGRGRLRDMVLER